MSSQADELAKLRIYYYRDCAAWLPVGAYPAFEWGMAEAPLSQS
jgi:hypothetical protein